MAAGQNAESRLLTDVVRSALRGEAAVLQLVGDAGIGKTHLLRVMMERTVADGTARVLQVTAVPSEADLPYAGLHALVEPLQDLLPRLPAGQRHALSVVLGLSTGDPAGGLLLGSALLRLLGQASDESPLLIVIDDLQWLDDPSFRCMSFAVRRLGPERVAVALATRPGHEVDGVPAVALGGLTDSDAIALLSEIHPDLVPEVQQELFEQTGGNPLALLEHARALTAPQRRGLEPVPPFLPASRRMHDYFAAQAAACPEATRRMLLLVALDDRGDAGVLTEAAAALGLAIADLAPAERLGLGLVERTGGGARFRSALVAQAVLQLASPGQLRESHAAFATALGSDDAAWARHAAAASTGPDEVVAERLELIALHGARSGAPAAAIAAFARSAALSADPAQRTRRLLGAAEAALAAGPAERAVPFLDDLDATLLPPVQQQRAAWLRGRVELEAGNPQAAAPLLLEAAAGRPAADRAATLAELVRASVELGDVDFARLLVTRAAALVAEAEGDDPAELRALHLHVNRARAEFQTWSGDTAGGVALLRPALDAFADHPPGEDAALWLALGEAHSDCGDLIGARSAFLAAAGIARLSGDLPQLADALAGQVFTEDMLGQWTAAYATGTAALEFVRGRPALWLEVQLVLAAIDAARGDESRCRERCERIRRLGGEANSPSSVVLADRREALLDLGLGRLPAALERLRQARSTARAVGLRHPILSSVPDLVELHVRAGRPDAAAALVPEFAAVVTDGSPPSARARLLRTRALVADQDTYPALFAESVALDERTGLSFLRARTLLCWGERLRRDQRRAEGRTRLREAKALFDALEAVPWSARAAAELAAAGAPAPAEESAPSITGRLTPQELQVAVLVSEGRRNKEIASSLFLSVRTVEFHLTSVFRKTGVTSRSQLAAHVLHGSGAASSAA